MEGDYMTKIMYDAWIKHGTLPSKIRSLPDGELQLLAAFTYINKTENL